MEVVFEEFVFRIIEKYFEHRKPESQKEAYLTQEKVFKIKNDILLKNPDLIVDTKYKIRDRKDNKRGILQGDMYQMLTYAIRRNTDQVLLIYPKKNRDMNDEIDTFTISDTFAMNKLITIKAADIDICCEEEEIKYNLKKYLRFEFYGHILV